MSEYKYILWDFRTGQKQLFSEVTNREYSYQLNRAGSASFTLPITSNVLNMFTINIGVTRLLIYRENVLIWAGVVWEIEEGANIDDGNVRIFCMDLLHVLSEKRYTSNSYTNTDAGQIAWGIINTTQGLAGGNLGITQGTIQATKNRNRTFVDEKIGENIIALTEVRDGFDFVITPSIKINTLSVFNVYSRRGETLDIEQGFEYGKGLKNNIQSWKRNRTLSNVANKIVAEGEGFGQTVLSVTVSDNELINANGLLEDRIQYKSVSVLATLTDNANEDLRVKKTEEAIYDITVNNAFEDFGSYDIGDIVPVTIKAGYVNIKANMRIYGISVNVSDQGEEVIKLTVSTII